MTTQLKISAFGPEGCGKTTVIQEIERFLKSRFNFISWETEPWNSHEMTFVIDVKNSFTVQKKASSHIPMDELARAAAIDNLADLASKCFDKGDFYRHDKIVDCLLQIAHSKL